MGIIRRPSREEIAYAAGLFEGEGSLTIDIIRKRYVGLRITIGMTDLEPLEKFRDIWGLGSISGPSFRKEPNRKPMYSYQLRRFEFVQYVLVTMWPWLSPRRQSRIAECIHVIRNCGSTCRLCRKTS